MPPKGWRKGMPPGRPSPATIAAAQAKAAAQAGQPAPPVDPSVAGAAAGGAAAGAEAEGEAEDGEGIEAFELPKAPVLKLARAAGPQNMKLAKEVPTALQKASTVFVSYLASVAHDIASDRGEKTLSAQHVLEACKQLDWEDEDELIRVLKSELDAYRRTNKAKKDASKASAAAKTKSGSPSDPADPSLRSDAPSGTGASTSAATLGKRPRGDAGEVEGEADGDETEDDVGRAGLQLDEDASALDDEDVVDEDEEEDEEMEEDEEEVADEEEEALMEIDEKLGGQGVEHKSLQETDAARATAET